MEEEALRPYLPEGWEPDRGFLPLGVDGMALMGLEAFECESGVGLNGTVAPMAYGSFWTAALPPEPLREENTVYTVRWDTLVPDADRRAVLLEAGMPARAGTASVGRSATSEPGLVEASYTFEGVGTITMRGAVGRDVGAVTDLKLVEFTPTERGLGIWRANWTATDYFAGNGVATVPAGSLPALVAGRTEFPITLTTGVWTFTEGTLTLPTRERAA
ncbi:MAG TPA: hypothetical protein VNZ52_05235 [Candidatus Thermoplasmatota archaeon]|nr:hypothetical protein [Candidatus Thermoplasmatota archaeon]